MVLAAGLGTRLRPLTDECPKPLVPIGDRPAIFHVLDRVRGIGPVVVNAHHHADALTAALSGRPEVRVSVEADLLGTAGGVAHARALLGGGDVLVWNADVLAALDPSALLGAHQASAADATLAVRARAANEGNVGVDADGTIVRLRRETYAPGEVRGGDFLGIHVISESLRQTLPTKGCLVGDVYLPAGHRGAKLKVAEVDVSFVDVGTLDAYWKANLAWLAERGITSRIDTEVPETVSIGEGVIVARDATVSGAGRLERVVAWPGARVVAPLANAIVTRKQTVRIP
jgi:mannose-1-phosphate guanylyltransferase